jgi:hypothetical protein
MFIFGKDAYSKLKINTSREIPSFDIALAGSDVEIIGKVVEDARIDEQYLIEWENEIKLAVDDGSVKVCTEEGAAINSQDRNSKGKNTETETETETKDPYRDVREMRNRIKESGNSFITIYAIKCISLKELKD